ncbi:MAG: NAD kinase [Candidatus Nanopelagicales bacterium]
MSQHVLLVINARHEAAVAMAHQVIEGLHRAGMSVTMTDDDARSLHEIPHGVHVVPSGEQAGDGCQLVVVLGGDGTILRGAELARGGDVALLGINLGHVGFLAEAEPEDLTDVVRAIVEQDWEVESRLALDVTVFQDGKMVAKTWALNEISLEKSVRERMVEVLVEVDARPLSRWGCDGVVCATPTGSTAYAFSAGGPVVWPEVEALVVVPLSAHALFARPLVVSPRSTVALELHGQSPAAVLWADGRRSISVPPKARIEVQRHNQPVRLARLRLAPFTDRLVAKFSLPVQGWRGAR